MFSESLLVLEEEEEVVGGGGGGGGSDIAMFRPLLKTNKNGFDGVRR